jgi:hypothetical protein
MQRFTSYRRQTEAIHTYEIYYKNLKTLHSAAPVTVATRAKV